MGNDYEDELIEDLQDLDITEMIAKANNIVATAVAATATTGAIPIPFADAPLLISEQVAMMASISKVFGINIKKDALKALAVAAIGVGGATVLGKTIATNLLKLIPGAGSVAGGAISAATAGLLTAAMGKAYIEVCKAINMGQLSIDDLSKSKGKDYLKREFKEQLKKEKKS